MNLWWSFLVVALLGPDDRQPNLPKPPGTADQAEVEITSPPPAGTGACCPAAANAAGKTGCCSKDAPAQVATLPKGAAPGARTPEDAEEEEAWPMTLREAFRIGLDNSEVVRVLSFGAEGIPIGGWYPPVKKPAGPIVISRLNAEVDAWRFKTEVMAEMRSVEQQYWNLVQAHAWRKSAKRAVSMAREVLVREEAELAVGRGTFADVAEASQRLGQFTLDWVTRTSDVITTERQLRNLLGLPPADNRRIIPVTPPTEAYIEFDWETCFREMSEQEPEIVRKKLAMGSEPPSVVERGRANRVKFVLSPAQRHHEKVQQAELQQVIQQKTHTMARMLLEVDAGYQHYQTAKHLREATTERLAAQRSAYEEGRITVDRFLDAISQHATAVATESECLATYNIALAALAEAKGTLLTEDGIVIMDPAVLLAGSPWAATGKANEDRQTKTASFEPDKSKGMVVPRIETSTSHNGPIATEDQDACCEVKVETARPETSAKPRTWTFSLSIGGEAPIQIKGTITAAGADRPAPVSH